MENSGKHRIFGCLLMANYELKPINKNFNSNIMCNTQPSAKVLLGLIGIAMFAMLSACKTTRLFSGKATKTSQEALVDSVLAYSYSYNSFSAKFSAKYKSETMNRGLSGNLRIYRDSVIWLSVSPGFGIEAAAALLTPDTAMFVNNLNSTYYAGGYEKLREMFHIDVDFQTIQSIFTNKLFIYPAGKSLDAFKYYELLGDSTYYQLQSIPKKQLQKLLDDNTATKPVLHTVRIMPKRFTPENVSITDYAGDKKMRLGYSDFEETDGRYLPQKTDIELYSGEKKVTVNLRYHRIKFNTNPKIYFSIPAEFKPI